jgi:hypothetical protein
MKFFESETMAIFLNFLFPSEYALKIATLSAHIVKEYELFSMLQPVKTSPSSVSNADPTLNFEYGAWAFF